jgi:thioredoxin-dependent peroxiredoxin
MDAHYGGNGFEHRGLAGSGQWVGLFGADPSFSVIKAYDAAFNIPLLGAAFANRISYVISPEGKILYAYSDSNAEKHIENTLAAVRKWREAHKP